MSDNICAKDWMGKSDSHVEVLNDIVNTFKTKNVLEFGCGDHSTTELVNNPLTTHVTSIEMNNLSWFERVGQRFKDNSKYKILLKLGTVEGVEWMKENTNKYDLIFMDGHGDARIEVINAAVKNTDLILAHDTEAPSYRWHLVNKQLPGWCWIDIKTYYPWTSVFTNRQDVIDYVRNKYATL